MAQTTTFYEDIGQRLFRTGRVRLTSTPAPFTISVGFDAKYVKVYNHSELTLLEWWKGMGQNTARRDNEGTVTGVTGTGIHAVNKVVAVGLDEKLLPTHTISDNQNLVDFIIEG